MSIIDTNYLFMIYVQIPDNVLRLINIRIFCLLIGCYLFIVFCSKEIKGNAIACRYIDPRKGRCNANSSINTLLIINKLTSTP